MSFCDEVKKRFIRLSRGQRKVAQFVIDNPNLVTTHTASEVGKLIGISESTVIRFCYAMDLTGYVELQEKIKSDIAGEVRGEVKSNQVLFTVKHEHLVSEVMNRDVANILDTIQHINDVQFEKASKWMHKAEDIYILGFRQSAPAASFLTSTLKNLRKHVKQIQHDVDHIVQQISNMDDKSLLIVVALDSILEDALTIAKLASNKKVKVFAITNSALSPIRDYAEILFTVGSQKQSSNETITSYSALMHALIEGMIAQNKRQYLSFQEANSKIESNFLFQETVRSLQ
ncbi:DNA-binding MurR/RpiR family transcriptional regulator [Lysinibacillus composti]|uniref:MurR/RpiR family transcriptional regulator n=1 Tax=Lysinibacillus composti TaxID=720633 RepID=A0A3N9UC69_9BACI|nr:MurR/RpiR family transcriptional regulator [Lysinibacillus composti]MBM7609599.1 DNA-binding MurR/RpiR family transcriptional regulator [Lysinibacillus composti]RQW73937.1 MurR/RpiR family transcriptional regulator [Lysinibacillus composti]